MSLDFENVLLPHINEIILHLNNCISKSLDIVYHKDAYKVAFIISSNRFFGEEFHFSLISKWKHDRYLTIGETLELKKYYNEIKFIIESSEEPAWALMSV